MPLAPQDCKLGESLLFFVINAILIHAAVIDHGWGQRHPFSNNVMLPRETLFIYAPRDEDEFRVFETIFRASIGFMTATRHVQP
jgi:hypothetical protein